MKRFLAVLLLVPFLAFDAGAQGSGAQRVHSVEGATEYRLANGLRVLLLPEPGADTITTHITYLVGSRHEGYGEKGMAHLLEHLLFKGSKGHPNPKEEMARRGARWNGTTSVDRTTYFQTFAATADNLDWALSMEADRMVNSFVRKSDLESEMTVVRNEFEMGENNPGSVLYQRMQQLAYSWHNYGNPIIGNRSDIEQVPIDRLQAFYRTWYQPDNAFLIVAGRIDEEAALRLVERHFGPLPKPERRLPAFYTQEPTQDGERSVTLRRVGETAMTQVLYRVPAGSHPEYPALDILVKVLGDVPNGRLHRFLVERGIASAAWGAERGLYDPGFVYFGAALPAGADAGAARQRLLEVVEGLTADPASAEEVERARTALLNDFEKTLLETGSLVRALSEFEAIGDWRLFFLYRDRLKKVGVDDVRRVAQHYLKSANRVVGTFLPVQAPERAPIPPTPDVEKALQGYAGGEGIRLGEAFDPSPRNIESRVVRKTLANGIRAALLPKKTRGGRALVSLVLHWGDEKTLTGREVACSFAGNMLMRGTQRRTRAQLQDELEKLNASVDVDGDGASIEVRREHLPAALRLVAEVLREPAFPPAEFDQLKRAALTSARTRLSDPSARASTRLRRLVSDYPPGHPHYTPAPEERIALLEKATLAEAIDCYRDLFGATQADLAAVGDFDPEALAALAEELFGAWKTPHPFARVPGVYFERPGAEDSLATPDKANAALRAGLNMPMRDDHPDFPAMVLANHLLGGTSTARIPQRVREKEGLSYSTYTSFSSSPFDALAAFRLSSIFAPQNRERVERALREEIGKARREGFGAEEVEEGKKALLEARRLARTQDGALVRRLAAYLFAGRSFAWDIDFEAKIAALTPAQVSAAFARHLDPERLAVVKAGDFKK